MQDEQPFPGFAKKKNDVFSSWDKYSNMEGGGRNLLPRKGNRILKTKSYALDPSGGYVTPKRLSRESKVLHEARYGAYGPVKGSPLSYLG